jgi:hypothetical protein
MFNLKYNIKACIFLNSSLPHLHAHLPLPDPLLIPAVWAQASQVRTKDCEEQQPPLSMKGKPQVVMSSGPVTK